MESAVELTMQRRTTLAFIEADVELIVLTRPTLVPDGMGGRTETTVDLDPQRCRVIPANTRSTQSGFAKPTGQVVAGSFNLLMGRWDMDVLTKDRFTWAGEAWVVSILVDERKWSTICHVEKLGVDARSTV